MDGGIPAEYLRLEQSRLVQLQVAASAAIDTLKQLWRNTGAILSAEMEFGQTLCTITSIRQSLVDDFITKLRNIEQEEIQAAKCLRTKLGNRTEDMQTSMLAVLSLLQPDITKYKQILKLEEKVETEQCRNRIMESAVAQLNQKVMILEMAANNGMILLMSLSFSKF